jgi:Domain of Unknown Function (DUF1206)
MQSKIGAMGSSPASVARQARDEGDRAAKSESVEWLGRAGLAAQGISFGIVGVLALELALGRGGKATSRQGALKTLADDTGGRILLAFLVLGFVGYAIWRFAEALFDRGGEGDDKKGLAKRAADFAKGCIYVGLTVTTLSLLFGSGGGGGGGGQKEAAGVLGWPAGRWLVGAAGLAIAGAALFQFYRAVTAKFMDEMGPMGPDAHDWVERIGQVGFAARGVVFGIIGWFLVKAALEYNAKDAVGLGGALAKLAHASYGPVLLGITAAGLIAFGLFCIAQARYRKV